MKIDHDKYMERLKELIVDINKAQNERILEGDLNLSGKPSQVTGSPGFDQTAIKLANHATMTAWELITTLSGLKQHGVL